MGGDKRRENPNLDSEEEEEEALSLCDLPVVVTNEVHNQKINSEPVRPLGPDHDDFEFGPWAGPVSTEPEMCVADDVFFQGQILPLRLSVSSDNCLTATNCTSSSGFTSSSSRSSSSRSHNSSTTCTSTYKPKVRNLFHSHPSPKPQVWFSGSRPKNPTTRTRRSTIWGLFRPGLVQTPEIELQHYQKLGSNKSLNSSQSSSSGSSKNGRKCESKKKERRFVFEGCKCSVDAIGAVSSRVVVKKKGFKGTEVRDEEKEKSVVKQRKEALYHRRTFEWLKELSMNGDVGEELNHGSRS